jgi:carbamoyl-phosphate synthase large subunit
VGEVMAIGRTFQESLQKALRGLEVGVDGLDEIIDFTESGAEEKMQREMRHPGPDRLWYVADAFRSGMAFDDVHEASKIDPWFLAQIEDLVLTEKSLVTKTLATLEEGQLFHRLK